MHNKVRFFASSALLFAAALGTSAHAQTRAAAPAAPAPAPAAAAGGTIEELVVTAEKRSQNLQDVPVAITAYSSEKRDLLGINSVQDMTNFTPGLEYSSQQDRISLRGVGRLTNVQSADPGVASYSDGVYTSSTVEAGKTPILTDRVEVLRGPQGTLYGRNSIGGAINVISRRPTEDFYGEVRATVGNYGRTVLEGAVSGPLAPDLQFRLAGSWEKQRDGYYTNVVPGMPSEGNVIDQYYVEGQLQGKFGDRLEGWMKAAITGWNNAGGGTGARATAVVGPINTAEFTPGGLYVNPGYACSGKVTNVVNLSPAGCVNPTNNNINTFAADTANSVSLDDAYILETQWTYHFDNFDLKYIGGYDNYHYTLIADQDATAIQGFTLPVAPFSSVPATPCAVTPGCTGVNVASPYVSTYQENKHWVSHELNLSSSGEGPLQWLGGLYYYKEGVEQPVYTTMPGQTQLASSGIVNAGNSVLVNGVPVNPGAVPADSTLRLYDDRPDMHDESYAGFGQVDWKFAPDWKATVGVRYSHDHKWGTESLRVVCYAAASCLGGATPEGLGSTYTPPVDVTAAVIDLTGGLPQGVVPGGVNGSGITFTPDGFAQRSYDANWSAWTGTAGLQWDPDRDTMMYARYSRGYKAGGFNVGITTTEGASPYTGPEHANNYEIGLKKNFFHHTLQTNLAVFYLDYQDFQAPVTVAAVDGGVTQAQSEFINVPKAVSYGVEMETIWSPIDHLQVMLTYAYNDAHITQLTGVVDPADPAATQPGAKPIGALVPCSSSTPGQPGYAANCDVYSHFVERGQDLSGNQLPNSTKNKVALNATYTWVMERGSLSPSVSYIWRDKQYGSIFERSYNESPAWSQVDARVTWKDKDNKYSVIGYVKNLFDTVGYAGGATGTRLAGTTAGVSSVQPGFDISYPLTPPRTYGVELQYRF
ncbi:TonB-dependent receptor [Phenylobacterium sp.]|uniref:TonB-dependent receptor n=1 Tax=Phenylobacterium sp. TaxID=1871053 RepID=UPI002E31ABAC|nr:TonB-dependent receptor [Phenylobacterium sp.]HEX4711508.1 TonB-dependent receptor [Phenylobacterium sp.]